MRQNHESTSARSVALETSSSWIFVEYEEPVAQQEAACDGVCDGRLLMPRGSSKVCGPARPFCGERGGGDQRTPLVADGVRPRSKCLRRREGGGRGGDTHTMLRLLPYATVQL